MPVYIGIDPGASGGLVALLEGDKVSSPMPKTERGLWEFINEYNPGACHEPFAVIEKVGGFIQGNPSPGSAMFKFGASYGGLRMALTAAGIPFEEVTPQRWQKGMGIPPRKKKETKGQFKNRLKQRACQLFPFGKITLATADAFLIATYCQRWREGKL